MIMRAKCAALAFRTFKAALISGTAPASESTRRQ